MGSCDNDRKIFDYLNPNGNDMLSVLNNSDRHLVISLLNKYYLELRDRIGISSDITFGVEIECDNVNTRLINQILYNNFLSGDWVMEPDGSIPNGIEVISPVLRDNKCDWFDLSSVCNGIVNSKAVVSDNVGGHIHVGTQILGNNSKYWGNFIKLWTVYENVIFRFLYGEFVSPRSILERQAKPIALDCINRMDFIDEKMDMLNASNLFRTLDYGDENIKVRRKKCVNFTNVSGLQPYMYNTQTDKNTIEFRSPNGTFDPVVWQNNINFLVKLMLYSKSDKFNFELIDRKISYMKMVAKDSVTRDTFFDFNKYSRIYTDQAIELVDLIFDNNEDKIYFLRQYIKSYDVSSKPLVRAQRFTSSVNLGRSM